MTRLLVSVRSAKEATEALRGGAQWIDVKEPARGSLGSPSHQQLDEVRRAVRNTVPLSVALGELCETLPRQLIEQLDGVSFAKVGLSRCAGDRAWEKRWADAMRSLPSQVAPVAVVYADYPAAGAPSPQAVVDLAHKHACRMLLCDTFDKSCGDLFAHFSSHELRELIDAARQAGMAIALAGSLTSDSISRAAALAPEVVAVRGAVCRGGRDGDVDASLVKQLVERLSTPRAAQRENSPNHILDSFPQHS